MNTFFGNKIYNNIIIASLFIQFILQTDAAAINVVISSPNITYNLNLASTKANVLVTCKANVSLSRCQFKVDSNKIFDLSAGKNTKPTNYYSYRGKGLKQGDCGALLKGSLFSTKGSHVIVCRVSEDDCGWTYASRSILSTASDGIPMNTSVREIVQKPGSSVNVTFRSIKRLPLTECSFRIQPEEEWIELGNTNSTTSSEFSYHGEGLSQGECGVTINYVKEEMNGLVWFRLKSKSKNGVSEGMDYIHLVVARPPDTPVIKINQKMEAKNFQFLNASCSVTGSRPEVGIQWTFSNYPVKDDKFNKLICIHDDGWTWPYGNLTTKRSLIKQKGFNDWLWPEDEVWCTAQSNEWYDNKNKRSEKVKMKDSQATFNPAIFDVPNKQGTPERFDPLMAVVIVLLSFLILCGIGAFLVVVYHLNLLCFSPPREEERQIPIHVHNNECNADNSYEDIQLSFIQKAINLVAKTNIRPSFTTPTAEYDDAASYQSTKRNPSRPTDTPQYLTVIPQNV